MHPTPTAVSYSISADGSAPAMSGFGGWPNALQGFLSSVVGGLLAAVVALLVVYLTIRSERKRALEAAANERKRALEAEARQVARDLVRMLTTALNGIPDHRSLRADKETASALNLELRFAAAMLAHQNLGLAQKIQDQADALKDKVDLWEQSLGADADATKRYNHMYDSIECLHEPVINWLGDVEAVDRVSIPSE